MPVLSFFVLMLSAAFMLAPLPAFSLEQPMEGVLQDYGAQLSLELPARVLTEPMKADPSLRLELRTRYSDPSAKGTESRKKALLMGLNLKDAIIKSGIDPKRIDLRSLPAPEGSPAGFRAEYTLRRQGSDVDKPGKNTEFP